MANNCESDLTDADVSAVDPAVLSPAVTRALGSATAVSLFPYISLSHSHSLNTLPPPSGLPLVLRPYDTRNRVDDDTSMASLDGGDAEVIAHVAFSEPVKVKMIVVHAGRGEEAPKVCKVFVNRAQGVTFDDATGDGADQDWELQEADEAIAYPTRLSKFHNVASLTFHFSAPSGGDRCRLFYIGALGESKQPKKDSTPRLDVRAENAADAPIDRVRAEQGGVASTQIH